MYQEVLALDPRHADALFLLGVLERQAGRLEEARRLLSEAVTLGCGSRTDGSGIATCRTAFGCGATASPCTRGVTAGRATRTALRWRPRRGPSSGDAGIAGTMSEAGRDSGTCRRRRIFPPQERNDTRVQQTGTAFAANHRAGRAAGRSHDFVHHRRCRLPRQADFDLPAWTGADSPAERTPGARVE